MDEYHRQVELAKPRKQKRGEISQRYMHIDAKDNLKVFKKKLDKEVVSLEGIVEKMAGEDKKRAGKILDRMTVLKQEIEKAIEDFER